LRVEIVFSTLKTSKNKIEHPLLITMLTTYQFWYFNRN